MNYKSREKTPPKNMLYNIFPVLMSVRVCPEDRGERKLLKLEILCNFAADAVRMVSDCMKQSLRFYKYGLL